ncbi:MAG: tRNA pseudouridine(38-40) synthase TruA [Candidatus Cloacimonadota bacterium]|nr:tRNA pseudouridine(38-40) synthase TruA [Candidatus Cloacimonadota bacterium]
MKRFLAKLSYDGTNFSGWQIQPNVRTVEETLEKALKIISKQTINVVGSGRTDAGVHALSQYAHFDFPISMKTHQIVAALNSNLPDDILIKNIYEVSHKFHSRYDAQKRSYLFLISKHRTPFNRFYQSYFPNKKLDFHKIEESAKFFLGKHDFTSFCKLNPKLNHHFCQIFNFDCKENENTVKLQITANRFLHNMVRRIVGTLVNISHEQVQAEIVIKLLKNRNPSHKLISTAPPQGLYLKNVEYSEFL